jgi:two-component system NtrC family response regulator
MIISAIEKHKGNVANAANELGISRPTLYDLLKKHNFYSASLMEKSDIP